MIDRKPDSDPQVENGARWHQSGEKALGPWDHLTSECGRSTETLIWLSNPGTDLANGGL